MKTLLQMLLAILIGTPGAFLILTDGMPSISVMSHREWYDGEISIIYPADGNSPEDWDGYLMNASETTGITLDAIQTGWDDYVPKVYTMAAAGDLTDIAYVDGSMARAIGDDMGMLAPLNGTVISDELREEFYPAAFSEALSGDDAIYVAPAQLMTYKLWVNQTMLEEMGMVPPETADEMMEILLYTYSMGYYMPYVSAWEPYSVLDEMALYVRLFDGDLMDWTHPGNIQAMEFMYYMVYGSYGASPELLYFDEQMVGDYLQSGQSLLGMSWNEGVSFYEYGESGLVMHALTSMDGSRGTIAKSAGFAMSAETDEEAVAAGFLRYVTSRQGAADALTYLNWYPARMDGWETEDLELDEFQLDYQKYLEDTVLYPLPPLYYNASFRELAGNLYMECIYGNYSADEFCYLLQEIIESEFAY